MLNIEKYKDEIKAEIEKDKTLGCVVNKLMGNTCDDYPKCNDCYLKVLDWLLQEYKEPIKPILTDKDKIIIKDIIKAFEPFGKKLKYITKYSWNIETKGYYNGDKTNNNVKNLEWCNNQQNVIHAYKNGLTNHYSRSIEQYDLKGNYIKTFASISKASEKVNGKTANIIKCAKGRTRSAYGYKWKYKELGL